MRPATRTWVRCGTLASLLISAACADQPTLPEALEPSVETPPRFTTTSSQTHPGVDIPTIDRFGLALRTEGTYRPGEPVRISVDAVGNLPTEAAMLTVTLPEVELARASSWGRGFSYRSSRPLPPTLTRSLSAFDRGAASTNEATVTIPAPGYYRVVAKLMPIGDSPLVFGGQWIRNTAIAETWLLISETGGRATPSFDPALVPDGRLREPGPFRTTSLRDIGPAGYQGAEVPRHGPNPDLVDAGISSLTGLITYHATYFDNDLGQYAPVAGAAYQVYICTIPQGQDGCEDWVLSNSGRANSSGDFTFACDGDEYSVDVYTQAGSRFVVDGASSGHWGEVQADCGGTFDANLPSAHAKVFLNMDKTVAGFSSLFGEIRSFIHVVIDTNPGAISHYSKEDDKITIVSPGDVWEGPMGRGAFVAAHEYGHAFHETSLGGNTGSGACQTHFIDTESNLQCAFSEGFADYTAAAARPDLASYGYRNNFEADSYFPGCVQRQSTYPYTCIGGTSYEGSLIEGAYAAFLFDLTDSTAEAHDLIDAPGSYVAAHIRTCKVLYVGGYWRRADGPDEVSYCVERAINPDGYFTPRGAPPYLYTESATEPGDWSPTRAHSSWTWNMYEKR